MVRIHTTCKENVCDVVTRRGWGVELSLLQEAIKAMALPCLCGHFDLFESSFGPCGFMRGVDVHTPSMGSITRGGRPTVCPIQHVRQVTGS